MSSKRSRRPVQSEDAGIAKLLIWGAVGAVALILVLGCGGAGVVFYVVYSGVANVKKNVAPDFLGSQPKDVDEAIAWLGTNQPRRKNAAEWLEKQPVNAARRNDVVTALGRACQGEGDPFTRGSLDAALSVWAGPEHVHILAGELENPGFAADGKLLDALGAIKSDAAARAIVKQWVAGKAFNAEDVLKKMGPAAEDAVADGLVSGQMNGTTKVRCCVILQVIGTRRNVAKVQQAMKADQLLQYDGGEAIKAMQTR
jgi:hypothetical protein